jgi:hypothetical protein
MLATTIASQIIAIVIVMPLHLPARLIATLPSCLLSLVPTLAPSVAVVIAVARIVIGTLVGIMACFVAVGPLMVILGQGRCRHRKRQCASQQVGTNAPHRGLRSNTLQAKHRELWIVSIWIFNTSDFHPAISSGRNYACREQK